MRQYKQVLEYSTIHFDDYFMKLGENYEKEKQLIKESNQQLNEQTK
ncbi:hypothetical protein RV15_GL001552 [Enterococcus silesiacus]|uniref:Uncharacterized protein n=1 Tax=Enterococcus silesiacus TaxID=332949 RepID=A0AA91GG53_9ENTE|nr:hypothetical protein [Enterococcus silesiacus]OJG89986.1 hypothetical protein RV15_GL001552 [Enterococcus silesiacus]